MKMIEEKDTANNSNIINKLNTIIKIESEKIVFFIFLNISKPALSIKKATAHLIPTKA